MDKNTQLLKLLSRLTSIKNNVPQKGWGVPEKYVVEFNSIIYELEQNTDEDLKEFKVPESEVRPHLTTIGPGNRRTYTSESYCDREFLLMKADGVLGFFTLLLQPTEIKNHIGFKVGENE